ncbi:MAG: Cell division coordinator CpoB [Legionellaceae bacterium]
MRFNKSIKLYGFILGAILIAPMVKAGIPVLDLTETDSSYEKNTINTPDRKSSLPVNVSSSLSLNERVIILEKRIANLTQMDLVGQINKLQQEIAKLRGDLDVQTYEIKRLNEQIKAQYQDIDSRLSSQPNNVKNGVTPVSTDSEKSQSTKTVLEPLQMSTTTTSATSVNASQENKGDNQTELSRYQAGIDLSRKGDYVRATTAFQKYLSQYPDGIYAANAHYWLGEIYLIQGQPDPAAAEFKMIITNFPSTPKVPDALLKLGQAYYDKGDYKEAKKHFENLQKQFSTTSAALTAKAKLQKMQQEGKGK